MVFPATRHFCSFSPDSLLCSLLFLSTSPISRSMLEYSRFKASSRRGEDRGEVDLRSLLGTYGKLNYDLLSYTNFDTSSFLSSQSVTICGWTCCWTGPLLRLTALFIPIPWPLVSTASVNFRMLSAVTPNWLLCWSSWSCYYMKLWSSILDILRSNEGNSMILLPICASFFLSIDRSLSFACVTNCLDSTTFTLLLFKGDLLYTFMLPAMFSFRLDKFRICC